MTNRILATLASLLVIVSVGCKSLDSKSQDLKLGMTKSQVTDELGNDFTIVGARTDAEGKDIEVIKYQDKKTGDLFLYLKEDELVQWGDQSVLKNMPETK